jgi:hypothetical protein
MPQRYQLIFGTPIPGYQPPPEMLSVAGRSLSALVSVVNQLHQAGRLRTDAIPSVMPEALIRFAAWQQNAGADAPVALTTAILISRASHGLVLARDYPSHSTIWCCWGWIVCVRAGCDHASNSSLIPNVRRICIFTKRGTQMIPSTIRAIQLESFRWHRGAVCAAKSPLPNLELVKCSSKCTLPP